MNDTTLTSALCIALTAMLLINLHLLIRIRKHANHSEVSQPVTRKRRPANALDTL